jgi:hypothetical protein
MQQSRVYVGMVLILIFGEVLGLYGYERSYRTCMESFTNNVPRLIVGLILNSKSKG